MNLFQEIPKLQAIVPDYLSNPEWHQNYIGIPFVEKGRSIDGLDCWGLVYLVYRDEFRIDIPSYTELYTSAFEYKEITRLIDDRRDQWPWLRVQGPHKVGDVVVINNGRGFCHVGTVIGNGYMLHIDTTISSCCEWYEGIKWKRRIVGVYRHCEMIR